MPDPIKLLRYPLFAFAVFVSINAYSQDRNQFKGKVVDSINHVPIELATVAVMTVKDSTATLFAYVLTDKKGEFIIHNLPVAQNLKLLISVMGYNSYRKFLTLKSKTESIDFGTIGLSNKQLKEITIKDRPPIVIRADTIEFAAEAFKVRPNAVVEDLLKRLPGVEVSADGAITVAGKPVSKVLVDGHQFFSNDPRIATKNLDADMIDKVQVYDDREYDPNHLEADPNVNKIINLKFKKEYKKSVFGKLFAGAGTEDRYETGGLISTMRDTLQVSFLGLSNNLNSTGFSFNDLYTTGGVNRGGGAGIPRAGIPGFGSSGNGIQKLTSGGLNINTDYGKTLKINLTYFYTRTSTTYNSINNVQRLLSDTDLVTNTKNFRIAYDNRQNISSDIKWHPTDANQFSYSPSFSFSSNNSSSNNIGNTISNFIPVINQALTTDQNQNSNPSFQQQFTYNHKFKTGGQFINIANSIRINSTNGADYNVNSLTSYTNLVPSYLLNRYTNSASKSADITTTAGYGYTFSNKLSASITAGDTYQHQVNNTFAYNLDTLNKQYDLLVVDLSSALTRNIWTENINPAIIYKISKTVSLNAGFNANEYHVTDDFGRGTPRVYRHYFDVDPIANLNIGKYNISYNHGFSLPNIGDLIPYSVVFSPLSSVTGNPNLQPATKNNFSAGYRNYLPKSQLNLNFGVGALFEQNTVFRQRTLNQAGVETSMPINMNGRYNINGGGGIFKNFKKKNDKQFGLNISATLSKSHGFFELNGLNGYQDTYIGSFVSNFDFQWDDKISFNAGYNATYRGYKYTGVNFDNATDWVHSANSHFIFYFSKTTSIEGNYNYVYKPLVSPGFQKSTNLLSMNIAHTFLTDKAQIKLTCYDILNQNINSTRIISENVITDNQSEIVRRYFLLTLQYKFNHRFGKKR